MSIKVSSISEYLYCPVKLYLKYHLEDEDHSESENKNQYLEKNQKNSFKGKFYINKQLLRDFHDLMRRNMWTVQNHMDSSQIENNLSQDLNLFIEKYLEGRESSEEDNEYLKSYSDDLKDFLNLEIKIMALKIHKIMKNTGKNGSQIAEMLFPPTLQTYLMRDKSLQISGSVDKIEIIEGKYFPIGLKTKNPPLRGVWDADALELAAYSLLIEQEFDTDIAVGFIDYINIDDRRPVVIDSELREGLFIVLDHIREIINQGKLPEVSINHNKCAKCDYMDLCHQDQ